MLVKPIYNSNLCVPSSSLGLLFKTMGTYHKKKIKKNFNHYFWNFCVGGISDLLNGLECKSTSSMSDKRDLI